MANLLDRFKMQVIGSEDRLYDYLSLISSGGDFKRVQDINVILNSWNNILLTPRGTYLHDPNFGSDIYKYVFEPVDDTTVEGIKLEVAARIQIYDNRASIESIDVILHPNGRRFDVIIYANYQGKKGTLDVKFDDSTYSDFLTRTAD